MRLVFLATTWGKLDGRHCERQTGSTALATEATMTLELGLERREPPAPAPSPEVAPVRDPLLIADTPESADLTGVGRALEPILELCLSPQAQTPFVVGMVGPAGSGKSFALRRFAGSLESLAQQAVAALL